MSCSHTDIHELAKALASEQNSHEALRRCAISRAYYAALHRFQVAFPPDANEMRVDGESSHAVAIRRARDYAKGPNTGRRVAAELAKTMSRLKSTRNSADYALSEDISTQEVLDALVRAESVFAGCDAFEEQISRAALAR